MHGRAPVPQTARPVHGPRGEAHVVGPPVGEKYPVGPPSYTLGAFNVAAGASRLLTINMPAGALVYAISVLMAPDAAAPVAEPTALQLTSIDIGVLNILRTQGDAGVPALGFDVRDAAQANLPVRWLYWPRPIPVPQAAEIRVAVTNSSVVNAWFITVHVQAFLPR